MIASIAAAVIPAGARADWSDTEVDRADASANTAARFDVSAGAQAFSHAWALYSGVTLAPFSDITADGLRLRASGGYGAYSYSGSRAVGLRSQTVTFNGVTTFGEILVGYQKQLGPLTVKGFAGLAVADHAITPDDPETAIRGLGTGAKGALELWWTISERAWSSVDLSWATLHNSYAGRGRFGWRFLPQLSAGVEAGAAGNVEGDSGRLGGFLRYEWATGEVSASGGWSSDALFEGARGSALARSSTPFATFSWLTRF